MNTARKTEWQRSLAKLTLYCPYPTCPHSKGFLSINLLRGKPAPKQCPGNGAGRHLLKQRKYESQK